MISIVFIVEEVTILWLSIWYHYHAMGKPTTIIALQLVVIAIHKKRSGHQKKLVCHWSLVGIKRRRH